MGAETGETFEGEWARRNMKREEAATGEQMP